MYKRAPRQCRGEYKEDPLRSRGLTDTENPGEARICFLIDPQINPSTLLRTGNNNIKNQNAKCKNDEIAALRSQ